MRRPRRNHSPAFTAKLALAALTSDATTSALASRFDVHAHQITQWKQQLVAQASAVFSSDGVREELTPAVDVRALHAKIGQHALDIDFLAGALGRPRGSSGRR
jgi:transposase